MTVVARDEKREDPRSTKFLDGFRLIYEMFVMTELEISGETCLYHPHIAALCHLHCAKIGRRRRRLVTYFSTSSLHSYQILF